MPRKCLSVPRPFLPRYPVIPQPVPSHSSAILPMPTPTEWRKKMQAHNEQINQSFLIKKKFFYRRCNENKKKRRKCISIILSKEKLFSTIQIRNGSESGIKRNNNCNREKMKWEKSLSNKSSSLFCFCLILFAVSNLPRIFFVGSDNRTSLY